jgi:hypothetical protein
VILIFFSLQCQYRIISGQRQSNRKGLVWVGSPVIDENVSLPTCKHCRNNALECDDRAYVGPTQLDEIEPLSDKPDPYRAASLARLRMLFSIERPSPVWDFGPMVRRVALL